ncbi:hypothetical protein MKW92_036325 [Papaver armeniacum]|nr:hypothetical protein MKW92_036325 [Papaver armeniacum]
MSGAASIVKAVKPKRFQAADIQTAAGWGMVAFTGAVWVVQMTVYGNSENVCLDKLQEH